MQGSVSKEAADSSLSSVIPLSDLENKWFQVYGRGLTLLELVIVELFQRLVPKWPSLFKFPDIPQKKLARSKYATLDQSELLLGLFDTTFGSLLGAYLFTTKGVYWRSSSSVCGHRTYEEIRREDINAKSGGKVFLDPSISLYTCNKETANGMVNFLK